MILCIAILVFAAIALPAFLAGVLHGQMTEAQAWRMAAEDHEHGRTRRSAGHDYEIERRLPMGSFW